jgi:hypothetical protein
MKAPFKLIFISFLFLISTVCLKAQERYDYAVIKYVTNLKEKILYVSVSGKEFQKIEVNKNELKDPSYDLTPLLNYVQKMTNDGWRLISTNYNGFDVYYTLEKKRT